MIEDHISMIEIWDLNKPNPFFVYILLQKDTINLIQHIPPGYFT